MENIFKIGDPVYLAQNAIFSNTGKEVSKNLLNTQLYIRDIQDDEYTIAKKMQGAILGKVNIKYLKLIEKYSINPYIVQVPESNIPIYHSTNKNSGIIKRANKFGLYLIVDEKNNFGKIQNAKGWIELDRVNKIKEL